MPCSRAHAYTQGASAKHAQLRTHGPAGRCDRASWQPAMLGCLKSQGGRMGASWRQLTSSLRRAGTTTATRQLS